VNNENKTKYKPMLQVLATLKRKRFVLDFAIFQSELTANKGPPRSSPGVKDLQCRVVNHSASWLLALACVPLALAQSFRSLHPRSRSRRKPWHFEPEHRNPAEYGNSDITLNSFTLTPSEFQLVNGYAPGTLSPGRSIYFTIKFVPDAAQNSLER